MAQHSPPRSFPPHKPVALLRRWLDGTDGGPTPPPKASKRASLLPFLSAPIVYEWTWGVLLGGVGRAWSIDFLIFRQGAAGIHPTTHLTAQQPTTVVVERRGKG